jgi:hypothetical protein
MSVAFIKNSVADYKFSSSNDTINNNNLTSPVCRVVHKASCMRRSFIVLYDYNDKNTITKILLYSYTTPKYTTILP